MKQKVLVIDDSAFIRRMLQDWFKAEPDFEVVGTGRDGDEAVRLVKELKPDIVTLDVEMPGRDGISALQEIMATNPVPVLMVSSVTTKGAALTIKALELGAYDFVTKPNGSNSFGFLSTRDELLEKARHAKSVCLRAQAPVFPVQRTVAKSDRVVLIASSTGGPRTLAELFEALPKGLPVPILIVQHMPAGFTASFAKRLDSLQTVPCSEAKPGDVVTPGRAYVAPGGKHMTVTREGRLEFDERPTIHGVRPAADYLFKTGAEAYGPRCFGLVLTGMGRDGAEGALAIRKSGGTVFGECESSCVVYGMPKAAKAIGAVNAEFKIEEMAAAVVAEISGRHLRAG